MFYEQSMIIMIIADAWHQTQSVLNQSSLIPRHGLLKLMFICSYILYFSYFRHSKISSSNTFRGMIQKMFVFESRDHCLTADIFENVFCSGNFVPASMCFQYQTRFLSGIYRIIRLITKTKYLLYTGQNRLSGFNNPTDLFFSWSTGNCLQWQDYRYQVAWQVTWTLTNCLTFPTICWFC